MAPESDFEDHDSTKVKPSVHAPGRPGQKPHWSTGAKAAVGTAVSGQSRMWFTIADGILSEIYFPDVDTANTRAIRFLVADGVQFFSDELDDADHVVRSVAPGVPAFHVSSNCKQNLYRIEKEIICDPARDALLLDVAFQPNANLQNPHLYLTIDAHMGDRGENNSAWVGRYKGISMLFAEGGGLSFAAACSSGFIHASCGFVGRSDGLADIKKNKRLTSFYTEATRGNVALTGDIEWRGFDGQFRLAFACGGHPAEAAQQARAALLQNFPDVRKAYVEGWKVLQDGYLDLASESSKRDLYRTSIAVMRTHESKRFPGGFVASLSIPWGFDRDDKTTGGYHVIWPRDLGETALGLLACGDAESARRTLFYLQCTQESDGNWSQNMWLDGTPHWTSTQMDGTSFAILLADALRRTNELGGQNTWPMIKAAAAFLVRNGPVTQQDRWEANPGYSPYTMAIEITALLAAADFADEESKPQIAEFLRATADTWNEAIDELTYSSGTKLAKVHKVKGYYFRILPPEGIHSASIQKTEVELKNHQKGKRRHKAVDIVSPDALALVRLGLRSADDSRIIDTVRVIDATLKTETSTGATWHRYTYDGYGEHSDGRPFDGTGMGRGWPLLAGERAHYEIARGEFGAAQALQRTIEAQTSECRMIPEQIWDVRDIPRRRLLNGCPTGSGMPLVWAHAEYVKLLRSLREQTVWDVPPQTVQRYLVRKTGSAFQIWTNEQPRAFVKSGKNLRIDSPDAVSVHWRVRGDNKFQETETVESGLGLRSALLPVGRLEPGTRVQFSLRSSHRHSSTRHPLFQVQVR